jgi:GNAT superfamily N-acetyltransferase
MSYQVRLATTADHFTQAEALLHDYVEWMRAAVGIEPFEEQPALRAELDDLAGYYAGAGRALFVAYVGSVAAGTVAVHQHADGTAELKRMYVRPMMRGRGLAEQLIEVVLRTARGWGSSRVWLESFSGSMDRAIKVYRRAGFAPCERDRTLAHDTAIILERPPAAVTRAASTAC